ncbi:HAD hydrolase-like protein [Oscillospiraceae bacterium LTW-04]|nr:HAD hydrolase-like protein [Oscillospiraceae bacterium MB24-C1]
MALKYTTLLFDLDGTLTDSEEGIVKCVQHSLRPFGIEENDPVVLRSFIGPPLSASYKQIYNFTEGQITVAIDTFHERFDAVGKFENRPYDGICELLERLKNANFRLMLATSKPEHFARQIMAHFALEGYFDVICGSDEMQGRFEKQDVIQEILRIQPQLNRDNTIMIGDRKYDVEGAALCGLDCIGVAYGFGGHDELMTAGAKYIVETVPELGVLLLE